METHVVEKEAANPAERRPVDGRCSATEEGPLLLPEVRNRGVRVVEERDHHCKSVSGTGLDLKRDAAQFQLTNPVMEKVTATYRQLSIPETTNHRNHTSGCTTVEGPCE